MSSGAGQIVDSLEGFIRVESVDSPSIVKMLVKSERKGSDGSPDVTYDLELFVRVASLSKETRKLVLDELNKGEES